MSDELTFDLVWMQMMGGGTEVLRRQIPASGALAVLRQAALEDHSPGGIVFLRPSNDPLAAVAAELERARSQHAPLNSAHEAYAVILEELDEFKLEVWRKRSERNPALMRTELIQIAVMALRAVEDLKL